MKMPKTLTALIQMPSSRPESSRGTTTPLAASIASAGMALFSPELAMYPAAPAQVCAMTFSPGVAAGLVRRTTRSARKMPKASTAAVRETPKDQPIRSPM